jgi:secondary thiamine-phosphate synthase enzyme
VRRVLELSTGAREELVDLTERVRAVIRESRVRDGLCCVYTQGATSAVMIQENWDASVPTDVVSLLARLVPRGAWLHDRQDGNGDAHLKAGIVGPGETIPVLGGELALGRWQGVFFCEFDGPREGRRVLVTVLRDATDRDRP